jgi:hypothetical protein
MIQYSVEHNFDTATLCIIIYLNTPTVLPNNNHVYELVIIF